MTKDVLLFDLGGVIVPWVGIDSLMARQNASREEIIEIFARSKTFNTYECGQCDDLAFTTEMTAMFHLNMAPDKFAELWQTWVHPPFPQVLETLEALKKDFTLACLSNTNALHWAHLNTIIRMNDVFDHCFASHIMGVAKPDPRSFQIPLEKMGIPSSQVLYFDDTKLNVESARKQGLEAHHVDRERGVVPTLKSLNLI